MCVCGVIGCVVCGWVLCGGGCGGFQGGCYMYVWVGVYDMMGYFVM